METSLQSEPMRALSAEDLLRAAFKYQDALTSYGFALLAGLGAGAGCGPGNLHRPAEETRGISPGCERLYLGRPDSSLRGAEHFARARPGIVCRGRRIVRAHRCAIRRKHGQRRLVPARTTEERATALHGAARQRLASELLLGFYRERLSCEKLADASRRSVNAVRLALSRTRARLRECVRARLTGMEAQR